MKIGKQNAAKIMIDKITLIEEYLTSEFSDKLSLVVVNVNGKHIANANIKSDKALFVLSGEGIIEFEGEEQMLSQGDCFFVPQNKGFKINGNISYISVAAPPFNPINEGLS